MTRPLILAAAAAAAALAAGSAPAQPRGAMPPPGDYFQTCRNVSTFGFGRDATMTAECRDSGGRWRSTSLRFDGCDRIENRDGVLSCRPAPGYRPPPGPGPGSGPGPGYPPPGPPPGDHARPTLTLFSTPNFGGRPFTTQGEITNLPREYNDRAMSLRIDGRRPWMVCTDSDFRGRCQVFDHDVPDLRQFGMAGKISSMQPVR